MEELFKHNKMFEKCHIEETRNEFVIAENEGTVSYLPDPENNIQGLKISNPESALSFLAFDYCYADGLQDYSGKRCDCLLFADRKLLFVELKMNITSQRRTTETLREGREQLSNTINYFYIYFKCNFNSLQRFAIVSIPTSFYPRSPARLSKIKKEFYDANYQVDYIEKNEFSFSG